MSLNLSHFVGCILGGAIGDALAADIENMPRREILSHYGAKGIKHYTSEDGKGYFTDETQLMLFTIEALLRYESKLAIRGIGNPTELVYRAYVRWLVTQGESLPFFDDEMLNSGYLVKEVALMRWKHPDVHVIGALQRGKMGSFHFRINDYADLSTLSRVAPIGLFDWRDAAEAFTRGAEVAALTHGHPDAYLSAGFFVTLLFEIRQGKSLPQAISDTLLLLKRIPRHEDVLDAIESALAARKVHMEIPEYLSTRPGTKSAHEGLALVLLTALSHPTDFRVAMQEVILHDGNSTTTAALLGQLLGLQLGATVIPDEWEKRLMEKNLILRLVQDFFDGYPKSQEAQIQFERNYPLI